MSGVINKVKNALHSGDNHGENPSSTNHGPHSSNVANKADVTVDSDRDGSRNAGLASGQHVGTTSHNTHSSGLTGTSHSSNAGPHGTIGNKADPRIDSDLDGSRNAGLAHNTHGHGHTGAGVGATGTGAGLTGSHGTHAGAGVGGTHTGVGGTHTGVGGTHTGVGSSTHGGVGGVAGSGPASKTAGPHSSNIANSADPRVDSDLDGSRNAGLAQSGPGGAAHSHHSGPGGATAGHGHNTHGGVGGVAGSGPGPAAKTAGPHSSDLANKLDPRVDSDLDGSKTVGGNKTYQA